MTNTQHIETSKRAAKAPAYIRGSDSGLYTAFVAEKGFRANVSLRQAIEFIRQETGLTTGAVPFFDEVTREWASEFDLAEGF